MGIALGVFLVLFPLFQPDLMGQQAPVNRQRPLRPVPNPRPEVTSSAPMAAPHTTAGSTILVLNFDTLKCGEDIQTYYSGSTGSLGSGPGPNYGVSFTTLALVTTDTNSPQTGTCAGNQTVSGMPSESNAFDFDPDAGAAASMNVPGGFTNGLSLYYLPDGSQHSLTLWDAVNGGGNPVTVVSLPPGTQGQWTPSASRFRERRGP